MDDIFEAALRAVARGGQRVAPVTDRTSPHSRFGAGGGPLIELDGWSVTTTRLRERLLANPLRRARLDQAIGMCLWNLRARDATAEVGFYNPNAATYSDDGARIRAPWGRRLLEGGRASLLARALDLLRDDPSSLRAAVPILRDDDLGARSRDVPCLLALHLLRRGARLHLHAFLRALDPYWVWPYDHFFLTVLLEIAAGLLDAEPGSITYTTSSLHVAEADLPRVEAALAAAPFPRHRPMPPIDGPVAWDLLRELDDAERGVRALLARAREEEVGSEAWTAATSSSRRWVRELLEALVVSWLARNDHAPTRVPFRLPPWAVLGG